MCPYKICINNKNFPKQNNASLNCYVTPSDMLIVKSLLKTMKLNVPIKDT